MFASLQAKARCIIYVPCFYAQASSASVRGSQTTFIDDNHFYLNPPYPSCTFSTSCPIGMANSGIRDPSSFRKARCGGSKTDALFISICNRFSSSWVLKLIRRHTVTELRDISKHRAMGKPGSRCWSTDLGAHWHTGLLSPIESLAVSMLKSWFKVFLMKRK